MYFFNRTVILFALLLVKLYSVEPGIVKGQSRPQEPKPPYPYHEQEVVFVNKNDGVRLAGTLTLPSSKGPFPAVLLSTGTGPQDRNENVFGHKPFLVLADHLTRLGIAVLRVDDRGVGKSTGNFAEATSAEFAGDAIAGIEYLKTRKEIAWHRIGLIGHSEGGLIAQLVASQTKDVAFVVMMAGPGLSGEQVVYEQVAQIARVGGVSEELIAQNRAAQKRIFAIIKQEENLAAAEARIRNEADIFRALAARIRAEVSERQKKTVDTVGVAIESQTSLYLSPWFRFYLRYDPRAALMKVKCPVLAVNGEKDIQVSAKENLEAIRLALGAGGNNDYTTLVLPKLNHLFQTAPTGAISEYEQLEETISPVALKAISDWIVRHTNHKFSTK